MTDILWAPWRLDYIRSVSGDGKNCFLCDLALAPQLDQRNLVVARTPDCMLLMNRYPYVNGHLLIAPYRHVPDLTELSVAERTASMELTAHAQKILQIAMNPQGFNIGINIGRCAGAGVVGHVHIHVVPRWSGDINFMTVVGQVRVIPQAVEEAFRQLSKAHAEIVPPPVSPPESP